MENWIHGVTLGGWLALERFITPNLFAVTTCHLAGNFCSHPGQPTTVPQCDLKRCKPVSKDYPVDEDGLLKLFDDPLVAAQFLDLHFDTFVTQKDVHTLAEAEITHIRVPMSLELLSDLTNSLQPTSDDVIMHHAWLYFIRLVGWCRDAGIQVWPDLSSSSSSTVATTARQGDATVDCSNVQDDTNRTLVAMARKLQQDGLTDVVTGIGLPDSCDNDDSVALHTVRSILGNRTSILVNNSTLANTTPHTYTRNPLYHVYDETLRSLSPRQHIAYTCRHTNTTTTHKNAIGEWSAAFDVEPDAMLAQVLDGIRTNAAIQNQTISKARRKFLKHFVEAQMVANEQAGAGWFVSYAKMEGGAVSEWDFINIEEGWIPQLPRADAPDASLVELYGECEDVLFKTDDDTSVVHEYPDPKTVKKAGMDLDDDLVLSHGDSLLGTLNDDEMTESVVDTKKKESDAEPQPADKANDDETDADTHPDSNGKEKYERKRGGFHFFTLVVITFFGYAIKRVFLDAANERRGYSSVDSPVTMAV